MDRNPGHDDGVLRRKAAAVAVGAAKKQAAPLSRVLEGRERCLVRSEGEFRTRLNQTNERTNQRAAHAGPLPPEHLERADERKHARQRNENTQHHRTTAFRNPKPFPFGRLDRVVFVVRKRLRFVI
mmetsp:Transcript_13016/g.27540  ORF Transcript_13016/g.27540 Transcript_13016/m.27540 type:complete len:126 (+) Transcript_13016:347-724(+)